MKSKTHLRTLLCVMALGAASLGASAEGTLTVGISTGYPPFDILNADGSVGGFDVEIAKAICEDQKKTCKFVQIEFDGIIPGLQSKKYDTIISSMGITDERQRKVSFTDKYYYSPSAMIGPKNAPFKADEKSTAGKVLAVERGSAHECYVKKHFKNAKLRQYPASDEAYLDLLAGRVDAVIVDTIPGQEWIRAEPSRKDKFTTIDPDLKDTECFGSGDVGIAVRKTDNKLREELNASIRAIRKSGAYQKISNSYFGRDIFGADLK